ncbi:MAG: cytochrome c biogenesis protein CcsA, partial [Pseudomonadales bacterium]|nr:cytochrome c biogenesis protein CcsA [Pseudomonadales bacterium]
LPMGTLMMWAINGLYLLSFLRRPVTSLAIFLFPVSALTIGLTWWLSDGSRIRDNLGIGLTTHIALSVIAYGLLALATVQALFVAVADKSLKNRAFNIMRFVPPLQAIDSMMFEQIKLGIVFLTLSIGSGLIYFDASVPGLIHHTFISVAAWAVFAILLAGRYLWGWRGVIASRWTVAGFLLLALAYFGSKIVLEVFLSGV